MTVRYSARYCDKVGREMTSITNDGRVIEAAIPTLVSTPVDTQAGRLTARRELGQEGSRRLLCAR